jgi:hypothetical protein
VSKLWWASFCGLVLVARLWCPSFGVPVVMAEQWWLIAQVLWAGTSAHEVLARAHVFWPGHKAQVLWQGVMRLGQLLQLCSGGLTLCPSFGGPAVAIQIAELAVWDDARLRPQPLRQHIPYSKSKSLSTAIKHQHAYPKQQIHKSNLLSTNKRLQQ